MRMAALLASITLLAHAFVSEAGELRATSSIADVSIGASKEETIALLGKPTEVRGTGDALDPEWHFGTGLVVAFWDRGERVAEIRATGPSMCTNTGVCPGMSLRELQTLIGHPVGGGKQPAEGVNQYPTTYDTCWLEVSMHKDRVASIAIKCQP